MPGRDPRLVARDILSVIRAGVPAGHCAVGTGREKLATLACRFLPPAVVESLAAPTSASAG